VRRDLSPIFKAYDVRGIVPDELDEDAARRIGAATVEFLGAEQLLLGRDCRLSSPALAAAFIDGATGRGADVVDIGLASTDLIYFASGDLDLPGAMFTASHNPPQYNGVKLCRQQAAPIGAESGLQEIQALAEADPAPGPRRGALTVEVVLDRYVDHLLGMIDASALRPLAVVADAANGMGALTIPAVFERLPLKLIPLFMELDGTFPNHPADPIVPANQEDLRRAVVEHGADVGLAFDGDADRVFLVDEQAQGVSGSLVTALVAEVMLEREPGASIIHNLICSRVVPEVIREQGGTPVRSRVGHSYIKQLMAETGAIFGGEHSGHFYFRDLFRADSGLAAALVVLERLSKAEVPLSELLSPYRRYEASGEINSVVEDPQASIERVTAAFADGRQDGLDGLTVEYDDRWFNVRASNTEPLLRLNVEAGTQELLELTTAEVLEVIRA